MREERVIEIARASESLAGMPSGRDLSCLESKSIDDRIGLLCDARIGKLFMVWFRKLIDLGNIEKFRNVKSRF